MTAMCLPGYDVIQMNTDGWESLLCNLIQIELEIRDETCHFPSSIEPQYNEINTVSISTVIRLC